MPASPFAIDPWCLVEEDVDPQRLGLTEALLTVSNGVIGLRGALEEGDPAFETGVFVSGVHETFPLSYPEKGYGDPDQGQALINVPDGMRVRLLVGDAPLDITAGTVHEHRRVLDMRSGTLTRELDWSAPKGERVRVTTGRLTSLVERSLAAVRYEVEAVEGPVRLVVQSDLAANDTEPIIDNDDPQVAAALRKPYRGLRRTECGDGGVLVHETIRSGVQVGSGCDHVVTVARADGRVERVHPRVVVDEDHVRTTTVVELEAGERLTMLKLLAYVRDGDRPDGVLGDHVRAHLAVGHDLGWEQLVAGNREHLDAFWDDVHLEIDGDDELQQALRYALFQVYQSSALIEDAPIGAKGLTGGGYSGHTFWDIEGFVVPTLTMVAPRAAHQILRWRSSTIGAARDRAEQLGLRGASFPWRTIDGHEASGYWPAGTAAMHVNADIARAFDLYRHVWGELQFERAHGVEVLVETARLWISLGHTDRQGHWHLYGLTGPDEYTAAVDDNVFTNLMAARNLRAAVASCGRHPDRARELGVSSDELADWSRAAEAVHVLYDEHLGVHPQCESFTEYDEWDFESWGDRYPVQEHAPYVQIYRHQVVKQADLVHALWWCGDDFTDEQIARDLDYYEARTVRDSSLSAGIQSVVCIQAGHLGLGLDYLREAAQVDLHDLQGNTEQGLHLASLAGAWLALTAGLGGLREDGPLVQLSPRLPDGLRGYRFRFLWRDARIEVHAGDEVTVSVAGVDSLDVVLYGEEVTITPEEPAVVPRRSVEPLLSAPRQPVGRSPRDVADA